MSSKPQALTSVGILRGVAENSKTIAKELLEASDSLIEFNKSLAEYYRQLAETWSEAQKKVNIKMPKIPNDEEQLEAYKRIWIDIFDNDFTELFDSESFGKNYGKLISSELELTKHWNNITSVLLKSVNLPNKQDVDEIYREIHSLRKRVSKLESELRLQKKLVKSSDK